MYFSPENSTYTLRENPGYFVKFENDLSIFKSKGETMFLGDMNARTGQLDDFVRNDPADDIYLPLPAGCSKNKHVLKRRNCDSSTNGYGHSLLEICKVTEMLMLNGRSLGDSTGSLTCHQYNGSSCVDYVIISQSAVQYVNALSVLDWMPTHSDHCQIAVAYACNFEIQRKIKIPLKLLQSRFIWNMDMLDVCWACTKSPL